MTIVPTQPKLVKAREQRKLTKFQAEEDAKWTLFYHSCRGIANVWWDQSRVFFDEANAESAKEGGGSYEKWRDLRDKGIGCLTIAKQQDEQACATIFLKRNEDNNKKFDLCIDLFGLHWKFAVVVVKKYIYHCSHIPAIKSLKIVTGQGTRKREAATLKHVKELLNNEKELKTRVSEVDNAVAFNLTFEGRKDFAFLKDLEFQNVLLSDIEAKKNPTTESMTDYLDMVVSLRLALNILKKRSDRNVPLEWETEDALLLSRLAGAIEDEKKKKKEKDRYESFRKKTRDLWTVRNYLIAEAENDYYDNADRDSLRNQAIILEQMAETEGFKANTAIFEKRNAKEKHQVIIDLHGFHPKEAKLLVKRQLYHCGNIPAIECLIIITGHGDGHSIVKTKVEALLTKEVNGFTPTPVNVGATPMNVGSIPVNVGRMVVIFDGTKHFEFTEKWKFQRIILDELVWPMWW